MATVSNGFVANFVAPFYICEYCDYKCSKKYNWTKHLMTRKQLLSTISNEKVAKSSKKLQQQIFACDNCEKRV